MEKGLTMMEIMERSNFKDKYLSGVFTIKKLNHKDTQVETAL